MEVRGDVEVTHGSNTQGAGMVWHWFTLRLCLELYPAGFCLAPTASGSNLVPPFPILANDQLDSAIDFFFFNCVTLLLALRTVDSLLQRVGLSVTRLNELTVHSASVWALQFVGRISIEQPDGHGQGKLHKEGRPTPLQS